MTWGVASSPIIYKNLAIVQCDSHKSSFIAAFDIENGRKVWSTPRRATSSWSTPTVYEGKTRAELIREDGDFHVIKAGPNFEILATNSMGEVCMATPAISGGMIILRTQHSLFGIGANKISFWRVGPRARTGRRSRQGDVAVA